MKRSIETHTIVWRGLTIEVRYEAQWLGTDGPFSTAHLEVDVKWPERRPLPFTETGYRSHFTPASEIDDAGGPVAFVEAWLEKAAQSTQWKKREEAARQMTLF
ncbi:hypothetical protein JOH52_000818 [Sinorhizobium meliloti]|uniref:hypothetical protein n=1 Tax=Rhizobium meliloti TaxID=382 RepID=UPI000D12F696|nr:hypothetical protein [Sinorhizobium meliloti]MBP2464797.1 hypothetical protein [Sinorhizobium meliloti]MQW83418.1 hypothetical protein [Sinorhizobium meliloti]PST29514.1 hypothetical protein C7U62_02690 [Mesorhizobium loti]GEC36479.1 hypothetical protein EME01_05510 [Sinorhizobium meliloti]